MRIGVLAVQGAFAEHSAKVCQLGAEAVEIRKRHDIQTELDGLILPGGFGTCAGMILLAKEISGGGTPCFGTLDISVHRNAYGRQLGSFRCVYIFAGKEIEMPFIRAPYATNVRDNVTVLASHDNRIVAVRQDNQLATAFHPELTEDFTVYEYFFQTIAKRLRK